MATEGCSWNFHYHIQCKFANFSMVYLFFSLCIKPRKFLNLFYCTSSIVPLLLSHCYCLSLMTHSAGTLTLTLQYSGRHVIISNKFTPQDPLLALLNLLLDAARSQLTSYHLYLNWLYCNLANFFLLACDNHVTGI